MIYTCVLWFKNLIYRCLILVRLTRNRTEDQTYQLQQFTYQQDAIEKEQEDTLKIELRKNSYQDENLINESETKLKMDQLQNQAKFEDCNMVEDVIQQKSAVDHNELRQFITETPVVEINDIDYMKEIGDKAIKYFLNIIDDLNGYEQLEDNKDGFSFWIKYIETPEKFQISLMRYTYTLNTNIENYLEFMKNMELQRQLDSSIDAYETHYQTDDLQLNYLRYKKILFMDPREFLYLKRIQKNQQNQCVEISKSVTIEDFESNSKTLKNPTRALLLLSGNLLNQVDENTIEVTTYSECHMKLKLKPVMTKSASKNEIKKMIKKYRDYFNQQQ